LREPGGTPAGEAIRALLLEQRKVALNPLAEAFLFQAARAQLVSEIIRPALEKGGWVICDRFTLSTIVYQGYAGDLDLSSIETIAAAATGGLTPDCYLVLWVPLKLGIDRRNDRSPDRMESKGDEFLRRVSEGFLEEAGKHPQKYALIDGDASVEEVSRRIWTHVQPLVENK
jgi:dTMP kinase